MSDKYPGGFITDGAPAGFSVYFDGSGDYLSVASATALQLSSSDFTVEFWVYLPAAFGADYKVLVGKGSNAANTREWYLEGMTAGSIDFFYSTNGTTYTNATVTSVLSAGQWYNIVLTRSGSTLSCWTNGTRTYNNTSFTSTLYSGSGNVQIGGYNDGVSTLYSNSYISNVRIVKGTALYSGATINTSTQLLNVTNTSLLTCQSPTIIDNSTNNFTITANGDAKVSNFTPFAGYTGFNPALGAAAGGVWTLDEAAYYQGTRKWPIYDPYFNNTTMMMHGNYPNNVPTWVTDVSASNVAFTVAGDTRSTALTPFSLTSYPTSGSGYFDGNGDYLSNSTSTSAVFTTGDFTIEMWVYPSTVSSVAYLFDSRTVNTNPGIQWYIDASARMGVAVGTTSVFLTSAVMTASAWQHIALVKQGTTWAIYRNGTQLTTATNSTSITDTNLVIGTSFNNQAATSTDKYSGYISNLRIVKGVAVYTGAFTTPTAPLATTQSSGTNISAITGTQTSLLTLQNSQSANNNSFIDSSTNNFLITRNGNTTQGTFTPFNQTGWSLYLPGSGTNYVQTPSNTTSALLGGSLTSLASLSFTIECFINTTGSSFVVGACDPTGGTADMILGVNSDGTLNFGATFGGYTTRNGTGAITFNQWNHVAWVVTGGYVYFYVNGAPAGSATVGNTSASYSQLVFGGYNNGFTTKEYLSNFRITKSAVYTGAFTPPTSKLTAITNTTLLTFQDNNYRDNSANNYTMVVVGSPYIQAFSPFVPAYITPTTYSNYFSGSGAYLSGASNAALVFGTGTYTVEMWVYQTARSGTQYVLGGGGGFQLAINSSGYIFGGVAGVGDFTAATVAVALSTWTHIVIVRNSTSAGGVAYYVNGVAAGTATDSNNYTTNVTLNIGTTNSNVGVSPITGCLSNLRVLKGTALYTAAFTPPTAPLTAITNTSLLTCQSSTFIDNSTNALALTSTGSVYPVTSPTPFPAKVDTTTLNSAYSTSLIGGSAYLDGSGDYLNLASPINFGTNAFTIEGWYYISTTGQQGFWGESNGGGANPKCQLYIYPSNSLTLDFGTGPITGISGLTASTYIKTYAWNHIVVCRTGTGTNQTALFINGVRAGVGTSGNQTGVTDTFKIGSNELGVLSAGYISGFRIVNGTSLYDPTQTGFAPPTTPPTAVANTYLLTNFTNAGIIDSTGKNVFETVDAAQISTAQSKYGGSSISCVTSTASGAYPVATFNNNLHAFYTGDFTVEAWIYLTTLSFDYSGAPAVINYGSGGANGPLGTATTWALMVLNTGTGLRFYRYDGTTETYYDFTSSAGTIPSSQWVHVAVSRSGTSMRGFVNGVPIGSTASTSLSYSPTSINKLYLGIASGGGGANQYYRLPGYIDDARITKGYARYTTNFTPPTSQLQDQ